MASNPAYTHLIRVKELPDQVQDADLVREVVKHPGWEIVAAAIAAHHEKLFAQLLNPTAKHDDVDRLRGELRGLQAMGEAADTIVSFAEERDREARARLAAQEPAHA